MAENYKKVPPDRVLWDKCIAVAKREPPPELTDDRPAIRRTLRAMRERRTVRVRSQLP